MGFLSKAFSGNFLGDIAGDAFGKTVGFGSLADYLTGETAAGINSKYNLMSAAQQYQYNQSLQGQSEAFNAAEAAKNRNWQKEMSDTSYQRAVADMRAAGINPMLAINNGGASTPTGSSASVSSSSVGMPGGASGAAKPGDLASMIGSIGGAVSAFGSLSKMAAETNNLQLDGANKVLQGDLIQEQIKQTIADTQLKSANSAKAISETQYRGIGGDIIKSLKSSYKDMQDFFYGDGTAERSEHEIGKGGLTQFLSPSTPINNMINGIKDLYKSFSTSAKEYLNKTQPSIEPLLKIKKDNSTSNYLRHTGGILHLR